MSNFDTSNIIKAMECHRINACHRCPYEGLRNCIEHFCDDAVSLVKKLGEENDRLRADTVRKMQSEIAVRCIKGGIYPAFVASTIDQIANELLNEEKCEKITKIPTKKCEIVKKTIDAIKSRSDRHTYSCMFSGDIRETYTISGKALDEIEKELLEDV